MTAPAPGILGALAAGIGGWNEGVDVKRQRMMDDEQRKRLAREDVARRNAQTLQTQGQLDELGGEQIDSPVMARLRDHIPLAGSGEAALLPKETRTFTQTDPDTGAILNYRANPEKSKWAREQAKATAQNTAIADRQTARERLRGWFQVQAAEAKARQDAADDERKRTEGNAEWTRRHPLASDPAERMLRSQLFTAATGARSAYNSTLARRPEAQRAVKDAMGIAIDPEATAAKRADFSADSTAKAQDVIAADAASRASGNASILPVGLRPTKSTSVPGPSKPRVQPKPADVLAWRDANPRQAGETDAAYKARAMQAFGATP